MKAATIKVGNDVVSAEGLPAEGKKEPAAEPEAPKKESGLAQKEKRRQRRVALEMK